MSFNKVILVGNLGRDPELRYTPQGLAVCDFSMATNERKKDKSGEYHDVPTWFRVTLWRQMAENATKYLTKGSPVYIEGRLSLEEWQDREGNTRQTLAVQGTEMHFIGGGERKEEQGDAYEHTGGAEHAPNTSPGAAIPDDDIPF